MVRRASFAVVVCVSVLAAAVAANAQAIDPSFDPGVSGVVYAIAVQPDGRVLVGGTISAMGGGGAGSTPRLNMGRVNADGTLEATFDPGATGIVRAIAVQPDGKILIGGDFTSVGGGSGTVGRNRIARLNADGTLDVTFDPGADGTVNAILVQPDGKILVGGQFLNIGGGGTGSTIRRYMARLNADGSVDGGFTANFFGGFVNCLAILTDGRILVGGGFNAYGGALTVLGGIARLSTSGALDPFFAPLATGGAAVVYGLAVQADGKVLVAGSFATLATAARTNLGRVESTGAIDASYNPSPTGVVYSVALDAQGRAFVGGSFDQLGIGTFRPGIGLVNADGTIDPYNPGANNSVHSLVLSADGRLLAGGVFSGLGGGGTSARSRIGRLLPPNAATQAVSVSAGNDTVTWLRGGTSPELSAVEFLASLDGTSYTSLGAGTRTPGGWTLTGQSIVPGPNLRIRAQGRYIGSSFGASSMSVTESTVPVSGVNLVENSDFGTFDTTGWSLFATPDMSYIQSTVAGGTFSFYRVAPPAGQTGQAVVFQQTSQPLHATAPIEAQFSLGNTDTVRKRISVLIHDADFSDLSVCTFYLPPSAPLAVYTMRTHTTKPWSDTTISFYAASSNSAGNTTGQFQLDDVSLMYSPTQSAADTVCVDPTRPTPPSGSTSAELIANGAFGSGQTGWTTFGQIQTQVNGGVMQFAKLAGTPAGVVFQATTQPMTAGQIFTATFQLGNSSAARRRVTVILHDNNFSDLTACTFWLEAGQPLSTYTYRAFAAQGWSNATLSFYPATVASDFATLLDNVTFQRTPSAALSGTHCVEPGGPVP